MDLSFVMKRKSAGRTNLGAGRLILATLGFLVALGFVAAASLQGGCATAPRGRQLDPGEKDENLKSFDRVWETIQAKHWDPHFNGVNWDSVRTTLRPRMEKARTRAEADAILQQMVASLGQSHFGIFPREVYEELDRPERGGKGSGGATGIDLRILEGRAVVVGVDPGSPAAIQGVCPGWEILRAGGEDIPALLRRLEPRVRSGRAADLVLVHSVRRRLEGSPGDRIELRLGDGRRRTIKLTLALAAPKGERVELGELPPFSVWIDTTRVAGTIGLARFNMFLNPGPVMEAFNAALSSWMKADGIIIDLRGNPGGLGGMAMGMAGWFFGEKGHVLGTMQTRDNQLKFAVNPRPLCYDGPLAILVDELSASTSEIMAAGLRDLGRARIFGARTAGAALPSTFERLPNGDGFQYAFANYVSQGGAVLENRGVVPDVEVPWSRAALLAGHDPALDAAVAWIHSRH